MVDAHHVTEDMLEPSIIITATGRSGACGNCWAISARLLNVNLGEGCRRAPRCAQPQPGNLKPTHLEFNLLLSRRNSADQGQSARSFLLPTPLAPVLERCRRCIAVGGQRIESDSTNLEATRHATSPACRSTYVATGEDCEMEGNNSGGDRAANGKSPQTVHNKLHEISARIPNSMIVNHISSVPEITKSVLNDLILLLILALSR
jgi:hypothetical protein